MPEYPSSFKTCFFFFCLTDDLLQTIQSTSGLAVILFIKAMFHPPEKIPDLVSTPLFQNCTLLIVRHVLKIFLKK